MKHPSFISLVLLLCACIRHGGIDDVDTRSNSGVDILFIGNSFTYVNDLPGTLAALARDAGDSVRVAQVTAPNLALIDHVNGASDAMARIRKGGWEYVVLQQGPTSTGPGVYEDTLVLATRALDALIRAQGGVTALYEVWPSRDRLQYFDNTLHAYQTAAQAVNGVLLPAGEAWRRAWLADAKLELYADDGLHPSPLGTYAAALVIYEGLVHRDVRSLPATAIVAGQRIDVSEATVRILQRAAHESVQALR